MNRDMFNNGIEELKKVKMTRDEKSVMIRNIFDSQPIESPYVKYTRVFAYITTSSLRMTVAICLIFMLSFGGVVYASEFAVPGNLLYPVKTKVVEPILDVVYSSPEKKVAWSEKKVERRLEEAESLAADKKLDNKQTEKLEKEIEKNSRDFIEAVGEVASSTELTKPSGQEKAENFKQEYRKKITEREDPELKQEENDKKMSEEKKEKEKDENKYAKEIQSKTELLKQEKNKEQKERVKKLKDTAIKVLDEDEEEEKSEKKRNED